MRELAEARAASDWLGAGSSVVQQGALRDLDRAFGNFFARRAKYPRWRKVGINEGFVIRDLRVVKINRRWATVLVPKVGPVRFRLTYHWAKVTVATSGRATLRNGQWHVSLTTPPEPKIVAGTGAVVGIDRGVTNSIATSNGILAHAPSLTAAEEARFVALATRLPRHKKGSKRRKRTPAALGVLRTRLTNRRTDWVEQSTTGLARTYDMAVIEALHTRGMTRRPQPKPDPDLPGGFLPNRARAKAGLNKAILASCWGRFALRLDQKMLVVPVNPRNTSRRCHECGHPSPDNRESKAVFECTSCGHTAHADINAARNILLRALNPRTSGDRTHPPRRAASTTCAA